MARDLFDLTDQQKETICAVFRRHSEITTVKIFGSRGKGTAQSNSDIDLALWGEISTSLLACISAELDELPLPYQFDLQIYEKIRHPDLREHIDRVGKIFYQRK